MLLYLIVAVSTAYCAASMEEDSRPCHRRIVEASALADFLNVDPEEERALITVRFLSHSPKAYERSVLWRAHLDVLETFAPHHPILDRKMRAFLKDSLFSDLEKGYCSALTKPRKCTYPLRLKDCANVCDRHRTWAFIPQSEEHYEAITGSVLFKWNDKDVLVGRPCKAPKKSPAEKPCNAPKKTKKKLPRNRR